MNGLGSNTCIQDAYNLAWKIAYVHRGLAGPSLLSTYSEERQPVGRAVVERANQAFRDHFDLWEALGALEPELEKRRRVYGELIEPGSRGSKRRQEFRRGIQKTTEEFHGLGIEMGQRCGGEAWKAAASRVSAVLRVPLEAHSIGFRQDWEDFYFEWERLRGVQESGAVLVRPDRFVAWRADAAVGGEDACAAKLEQVMRSVLCLDEGGQLQTVAD